MHGVPSGKMSLWATGKQVLFRLLRQQRLHASATISHIQLCMPCVSQYGTHVPLRHRPRSAHSCSSAIAGALGQSAEAPLQVASPSQAECAASRHTTPGGANTQPAQHGEFLSLQTAPWFFLSLQFLSQHISLSSVPSNPASHSSPPSTRKLPQKLSSGSEKQRPDFA